MKNIVFFFFILFTMTSCAIIFGVKRPVAKNPQNEEEKINGKNNTVLTNKISCLHKVLDNGPNLRIHLQLDITRLYQTDGKNALMNEFDFNYGLLADYNSQEFIKTGRIVLESNNIQKNGNKYYIFFDILKESMPNALLLIEIIDKKNTQKLVYDVPLNFVSTNIRNFYALFNLQGTNPFFNNYLSVKDTVQIKSTVKKTSNLYVRHFLNTFPAANTPMSLSAGAGLVNLKPDSSFTVASDKPVVFEKEGIYEVLEDEKSFFGLSFFVTKNRFPKLAKITDLIEPLIYITTETEMQQLKSAENPKEEMDKLWLKLMSGNVNKAKQTIKNYYERVRIANEFFTTYKEGWKTDMGMIFIVFGTPGKVRRLEDREIWTYSQSANFSEINFTFANKPNQFSDEEYVLVRYSEYEQIWYPAIELWRSGQTGIN